MREAMPITCQLIITIAVTACGASFQFYNFGALNNAQNVLETWINQTYFQRNGVGLTSNQLTILWSCIVGCFPIGGLIGSTLTRGIAEKIGRRNGLLIAGSLVIVGLICEALSKFCRAPELFMVGRFLTGVCNGLNCGLVPLYLTEIAPTRYRGAAGTAHQIAVAFGDWFGFFMTLPYILGTASLWPLALCFSIVPAVLLCVVLPFSPESSKYLISLGDRVQSRRNLEKFVGEEAAAGVYESLLSEAAKSAKQKAESGPVTLRTLFCHRSLRIPTLIAIMVMIGQQFTGIAAIFAYSSQIFREAGLNSEEASFCTVGIGISYFLFTLPSPYLIERMGRRTLSLTQLTGCMTNLVLLSVFIWLRNQRNQLWASYAAIVVMELYMCFYGAGSPIPWLIASELFSQKYRSLAVSLGTFVSFTGAFVVSVFYLPFQQLVGPWFSFLPFIGVTLLVTIAMAAFLPETKNRSIDDILREFRSRKRHISEALTRSTSRHGIVDGSPNEKEQLIRSDEGNDNEKRDERPTYFIDSDT